MSEYQRYEFMVSDRPLTAAELAQVQRLSSHITASTSHALIEYHWGDFKHDPITVLHQYFDGFLYWASWGMPHLGLRFPHGVLPDNLLDGYGFLDDVTLTQHQDYDILEVQFAEMEAPDVWTEYQLAPLMPLREEFMAGDPRPLYILYLAAPGDLRSVYETNGEEDDDFEPPAVPAGLGKLTVAQEALADLFRVPPEILAAAARHGPRALAPKEDDVAAYLEYLPIERRSEYLVRLAHHEPGLSHQLVSELRTLRRERTSTTPPTGDRVRYATLLEESKTILEEWDRQEKARKQRKREKQLHEVHDHQEAYWKNATEAAQSGTGSGYDEATRCVVELRAAAQRFGETPQFDERFAEWIRAHLRRPAFLQRMRANGFPLPSA